jgi:hypothetical protein
LAGTVDPTGENKEEKNVAIFFGPNRKPGGITKEQEPVR